MLNEISRARLLGYWFAAVIGAFACGVAAGVPMTASALGVFVAVALVPPGVMLGVWPSAPPVTVTDVLYAVDKPSTRGR